MKKEKKYKTRWELRNEKAVRDHKASEQKNKKDAERLNLNIDMGGSYTGTDEFGNM